MALVAPLQLLHQLRVVQLALNVRHVPAGLSTRRRSGSLFLAVRGVVHVVLADGVVIVADRRGCSQVPEVVLDTAGWPTERRRRSRTPRTAAEVDVVLVSNGRNHKRHDHSGEMWAWGSKLAHRGLNCRGPRTALCSLSWLAAEVMCFCGADSSYRASPHWPTVARLLSFPTLSFVDCYCCDTFALSRLCQLSRRFVNLSTADKHIADVYPYIACLSAVLRLVLT